MLVGACVCVCVCVLAGKIGLYVMVGDAKGGTSPNSREGFSIQPFHHFISSIIGSHRLVFRSVSSLDSGRLLAGLE